MTLETERVPRMKTCNHCKISKSLSSFNIRATASDGLQRSCRICQSEMNKSYYKSTPERNKNRTKHRDEKLKIIKDITRPLFIKGCVDCGNFFPDAMDFDHVRGKKFISISKIQDLRASHSEIEEILKNELLKCDVRCANCHRIKTMEGHKTNLRLKFLVDPSSVSTRHRYVYSHLKSQGCVDCHIRDLRVLEFDHIYASKKEHISRMTRGKWTLKDIAEEIEKCCVRCVNCHRKKTFMQHRGEVKSLQERKTFPSQSDITCNCGNGKSLNSITCIKCSKAHKINWPEIDVLLEMLQQRSFLAVAADLGVSDNGIRKHLKRNGYGKNLLQM